MKTTIGLPAGMMVEAGVHHLLVLDRDRCVGVLHESDVLCRL